MAIALILPAGGIIFTEHFYVRPRPNKQRGLRVLGFQIARVS
jgi:hypothetical protein